MGCAPNCRASRGTWVSQRTRYASPLFRPEEYRPEVNYRGFAPHAFGISVVRFSLVALFLFWRFQQRRSRFGERTA